MGAAALSAEPQNWTTIGLTTEALSAKAEARGVPAAVCAKAREEAQAQGTTLLDFQQRDLERVGVEASRAAELAAELAEARHLLAASERGAAVPTDAEIIVAAETGDCVVLRALLAAGGNVEAESFDAQRRMYDSIGMVEAVADATRGMRPAHVAAWKDCGAAALQVLIDAGADFNARDGFGAAPLGVAAMFGSAACVGVLVGTDGVDLEIANKQGASPLMNVVWQPLNACGYRRIECVKMLIAAGADVHTRAKSGSSLLMVGARSGSSEAIRALLDTGICDRSVRKNGMLAVHFAAIYGRVDCVALLAANNADARTTDGRTVAHAAARAGHGVCVRAAEAAGADLGLLTPAGGSVWLACLCGGVAIRDLSDKAATKIGEKMAFAATTFSAVVNSANPEACVKEFISNYGTNARLPSGETFPHFAVARDATVALRAALVRGCNPEARTLEGLTVALAAAKLGKAASLRVLAELGADMEAQGPDGRRVFAMAEEDHGIVDVVDHAHWLDAAETSLSVATIGSMLNRMHGRASR